MNAPLRKKDPVQVLFDAALERPAAERDVYLVDACGGDAELRREVDSLLRLHDEAEELLRDPAVPAREQPGDCIGRFALVRRIGEGGFGTVWLAEQDGPVRRQVALKVLKAGMDSAQVVARFEAERQALARMDHPHIARVLDGGTTPSGLPYFAMELVDGVPLTQFCDEHALPPRERIELFVAVCQAVQHAHHKGVIHRDLKPSNVLVALHEGAPLPKVIDFGIAKAIAGRLTERTYFTGHQQIIGTPEYMAPEQADTSGMDIDTRADVYSLGVLLYELLTGTRPFEARSLQEAGFAEMLRTIKEVEPPKPSTRIDMLGERLGEVARQRRMHPRALGPSLRGDLDWIVMRALEKDRDRRYATPAALADDLRRHLDSEPVLAGPPSRLYRLRKYVRRHRAAVAATSAVAFVTLLGAGAAASGYFEATEQARLARAAETRAKGEREAAVLARAEEQQRKLEAVAAQGQAEALRILAEQRAEEARRQEVKSLHVAKLLESMLASSDPHVRKGTDYTVRQLLDDFALQTLPKLEGEPEVVLALLQAVARSYLALGLPQSAEPHIQKAKSLAAEIRELAPAAAERAECEALYARYLRVSERYAESSAVYADLLVRAGAHVPVEVSDEWRLAMADCETKRGKLDEAVRVLRGLLADQQERDGDQRAAMAMTMQYLGVALGDRSDRGDLVEAARIAQWVLDTHCELLDPADYKITTSLSSLARALQSNGQLAKALEHQEEVLRRDLAYFGPDHVEVASTRINLAVSLFELGKHGQAETQLQEAVSTLRRIGSKPLELARALNVLGAVLEQRQNGSPAALAAYRESLEIRRRELGNHDSVARTLQNLALAQMNSAPEESRRLLEEALVMRIDLHGPDHLEVAVAQCGLADVLMRLGDLKRAEALLRSALATREAQGPMGQHPLAGDRLLLGRCLVRQGTVDEGIRLIERSLALRRAALLPEHPGLADPLIELVRAKWQADALPSAIEACREGLAIVCGAYDARHPLASMLAITMVQLLLEAEIAGEAKQAAIEHVEMLRHVGPEHRSSLAFMLVLQARAERMSGLPEAAHAPLQEALALCLERIQQSEVPDRPMWASAASAAYLLEEGRVIEAEQLLRANLSRCEESTPGQPHRWIVTSLLGAALARQDRFEEAEPLLLSAAEHLPPHLAMPERRARGENAARLVELYTRWGKSDEAECWRRATR